MGRPQTISNEEMLAAARTVFLKHGVFGSTREIAKRAGVSEAALFKRFATKAQLFLAAMAPPTPGIDGIVADALAAKSAREGVQLLSDAVLDYFRVAIPMILPLVSHPTFSLSDRQKNFKTNPAPQLLGAVASYLRAERARGRIDAREPEGAAVMLVSALHSVVLFEIMGFHGGEMPAASVRAAVDALWHGLEPSSKRAKGAK